MTYIDPQQVNPSANTDTDLYTVPPGKTLCVSSLVVCEVAGAPASIRVAIRAGGAALANKHYQVKDVTIGANEHDAYVEGWTAAAGTVFTVRATTANVSFSLHGDLQP